MGVRIGQNLSYMRLIDHGVVSRHCVVVSCVRRGVSVVRTVSSVVVERLAGEFFGHFFFLI